MHLLLLPMAGFIIIDRFPTTYFKTLYSRSGISNKLFSLSFSVIIATFLGSAAIYLIATDPPAGFCKRWPQPSDVSDPDIRIQMIEERVDWYEKLKDRTALLGEISPHYQEYQKLVNKIQSECNFWNDATYRAYWAALLTFEALIVIGVFLWICFSYFFSRPLVHPTESEWVGLVLVLVILSPWIAFRPLSEWIINFGKFDDTTYGPLLISIVFVFIAIGVLIAIRPKMPAVWVLATVVTGGSLAITTVAAISQQGFSFISRSFSQQELGMLIIEYGVLSFFIIGMILRITSIENWDQSSDN